MFTADQYVFFQSFYEIIPFLILPTLFAFVLYLSWLFTSLAPLNYNLWLVQIQRNTQQPVARVISMTDRTSQIFEPLNADESEGRNVAETTNLLVIQTPSSVQHDLPIRILHEVSEANHQHEDGNDRTFSPATPQNSTGQNGLDSVPSNPETIETTGTITINPEENSSDVLTIRLKFLDDTQRLVNAHKNSSVGLFKREQFSEHLAAGKVVRLIFQGRLLRDDRSTLDYYGLHDQCVLHCHIGTRPYATSDNEHSNVNEAGDANGPNNAPTTADAINNTLGPRLGAAGVWFDLFLFYAWSLIMAAWEWSNGTEEVLPANQNIFIRTRANIRSFLRIILEVLFGSTIRSRNARQRMNDDVVRYNVGELLALLVFVKFTLLWTFVLFYPQFTDRRSMFMLSVLTATTGLYFYFNRSNIVVQNRRQE